MEHATREAACVSRNLDVLGPGGVEQWRISIASVYILGLYTGTVTLSEPAHPREWDGEGGTVALVPS